jgi:hypothetical protein
MTAIRKQTLAEITISYFGLGASEILGGWQGLFSRSRNYFSSNRLFTFSAGAVRRDWNGNITLGFDASIGREWVRQGTV